EQTKRPLTPPTAAAAPVRPIRALTLAPQPLRSAPGRHASGFRGLRALFALFLLHRIFRRLHRFVLRGLPRLFPGLVCGRARHVDLLARPPVAIACCHYFASAARMRAAEFPCWATRRFSSSALTPSSFVQ